MQCPSCTQAMDEHRLAGNYGKTVVLDLCYPCNGMWFDGYENLQLTPGSVLRLFRLIHEKHTEPRQALATIMRCPRCAMRLQDTADRQRNTCFQYVRCPREHGRFMLFLQFLREKNFVRTLDAAEVTALKQHMKMVHCASCGAAVDLEKATTCAYCRTPIAMLDARQIEKTLRALHRVDEQQRAVDQAVARRQLRERLSVESLSHRVSSGAAVWSDGLAELVEAGLETVVETMAGVVE